MTITAILYLVGGCVVTAFIGVIVFKLNRAKKDRAENKKLKSYNKKIVKTEKQKNDIREAHNETANDININPNGDNDVLPNVPREHNHKFRDPCTENCPAHGK